MATMAGNPVRMRARSDRMFHGGVAIVCSAVLLTGFARTWFLARWMNPAGEALPLILKLHGVALTAWMLLALAQPLLVASGRRGLHRRLGYASLVLAPVLVVTMVAASIVGLRLSGIGPVSVMIAALNVNALLSFAILYGLAVRWRHRAETHKRLMTMLWVVLVGPGLGRTLLMLHAPLPLVMPVADLILVAGAVTDKAVRGRVHAVWKVGGPLMVASQIVTIVVANTPAWGRLCAQVAGTSALAM